MKLFNKIGTISLLMFALAFLSGCAAGAATAGYSLKSQSADSLTVEAEQRLVDRVKREVMAEIKTSPCTQTSHSR